MNSCVGNNEDIGPEAPGGNDPLDVAPGPGDAKPGAALSTLWAFAVGMRSVAGQWPMLLAHGAAFAAVAVAVNGAAAAMIEASQAPFSQALLLSEAALPLALLIAAQIPRPLANAAINGGIEPGYRFKDRIPTVRKLRDKGVDLRGILTRGAAGGIDGYLPASLAALGSWWLAASPLGTNPLLVGWVVVLNLLILVPAAWRLRGYLPRRWGHGLGVLALYVGVLVLASLAVLWAVQDALWAGAPAPGTMLDPFQLQVIAAMAVLAVLRPALIAGYFVALDGSLARLRRRIQLEQGLSEAVFD